MTPEAAFFLGVACGMVLVVIALAIAGDIAGRRRVGPAGGQSTERRKCV